MIAIIGRGPVAQWLEQSAHNRLVVSSILTRPTSNYKKDPSWVFFDTIKLMKRKQRRTLLISNILHIFGISILAPVYALYGLTLGANAWQIGASWGIYNLVAGISTIIIGRFIDGSHRNKTFIVIGYTITILGIILFLFATNASQLYMIMAVNAVGVGFYMPAWKAMYTKAENQTKIASEWGVFDGTNMIAMAVAAVLAGYLVNIGRYNIMFGVIIVFYTGATIVVFRLKEKS